MGVLFESFLSSDWLVRHAAGHVFKCTGIILISTLRPVFFVRYGNSCIDRCVELILNIIVCWKKKKMRTSWLFCFILKKLWQEQKESVCLHRIKHGFVSLSIPRCHKYSQILEHHIIIILVFYIQTVPQIIVKITEMHLSFQHKNEEFGWAGKKLLAF